MKKPKDEWEAIEQVSKDKDDEIYRKFCYVLHHFEQAMKLLKRLESDMKGGVTDESL